jgi:hypothetical protein
MTTINVLDAIAQGRYENKVPYEAWRMTRNGAERRREQRNKYRAEEARLISLFKADLENQHGVAGHPKADRLFELAWDYGHSSGYNEVAYYYDDLAELIKP